MSAGSTLPTLIVLVVGLGTAIGMWRARRRRWRDPALWAQPLAAALLIATLLPPSVAVDARRLLVLTPGTTAAQLRALPWLAPIVSLPGAPSLLRAEPQPDLATALRQHPLAAELQVIGNGLPPRDIEAVGGRALSFDAAPEAGIVELEAPRALPLGTQMVIHGRLSAAAIRVALFDPSGARTDAADVDAGGRFTLSAAARAAGQVRFELRAFDGDGQSVDQAGVTVVIEPGEPLRAVLQAATPDADSKYWRRWAQDAGIGVDYRAGLSTGVAISAGTDAGLLDASALQQADIAVIDERAWAELGAEPRKALLAAVDGGLGLLLKITGPLTEATAADWASLGFPTTALDSPVTLSLDRSLAMHERAAFTAAPVALQSDPGAAPLRPLLTADDGSLLAAWRPRGAGRIAVWRLLDSYRLVLAGEAARHGALWGKAVGTLARAAAPLPPGPDLPAEAWVDERAVLCRLGAAASLLAPDGQAQILSVRSDGCAGAWPGEPGWYRVDSGGSSGLFAVRGADDARGLRAMRDRTATARLLREPVAGAAPQRQPLPTSRWPWFIAWLLAAGLLWWRERQVPD